MAFITRRVCRRCKACWMIGNGTSFRMLELPATASWSRGCLVSPIACCCHKGCRHCSYQSCCRCHCHHHHHQQLHVHGHDHHHHCMCRLIDGYRVIGGHDARGQWLLLWPAQAPSSSQGHWHDGHPACDLQWYAFLTVSAHMSDCVCFPARALACVCVCVCHCVHEMLQLWQKFLQRQAVTAVEGSADYFAMLQLATHLSKSFNSSA